MSTVANVCDICGTPFVQKCHLTRHKKVCVMKRAENRIKEASAEYRRRLEAGSRIERILKTCPDTLEEALDGSDKACLKLYQASCEAGVDIAAVTLKPWQEDVIRFIDTPSDRCIYWIVGKKGNEGKSFIQNYICRLYGTRRVVKSEINARKGDIAYVLSQTTLTCKDIFVFNLLRSDLDVAYGLLENIKDGFLISSKYRSKPLRIQTPNTVLIFSNSFPERVQLSDDRWKIHEICDNKLCSRSLTFAIMPPRHLNHR